MIIALVNSKGGVGKSTIAGNLAGWLHAQGKSVILVDCDCQQSCSEWLREAVPDMPIIRMAVGWRKNGDDGESSPVSEAWRSGAAR